MARFRLFGRPQDDRAPGHPAPPPGWPQDPGRRAFPAGPDTAARWADGPATRSARPGRRYPGDPPTDPHGYPPVAGPPAGSRSGAAAGTAGPAPLPDRADAAALAGAFAADYLSWDEDDPARRGRVLAGYLPAAAADPARLGWAGTGRQRAEFVLPGRVRPDGEGRVLVDVRVRVTPYRPTGDERGPAAAEPEPEVGGVPAAAPAPTARGWRSLASYWVRLTVPVVLDGGRLLVDAWEELLGAELPAPPRPAAPAAAPAPLDHCLDGDEPVPAPIGAGR